MSVENFLGIKAATVVAGFVGAVVSLSAVASLTRTQAGMAVLVGVGTSAYITPAVVYYYTIEAEPLHNGLAFMVGLVAMQVVPGVIRIAEMFKANPLSFIKRMDGGKGNDPK
jgi:hypothetical protein